MAQPLLATNRLSIHYAVDGLNHVYRGYCDLGDVVDGNPGVLDRSGASTISLQDAADRWWALALSYFGAAVVQGTVFHEQLSGPVWNPIGAVTPTHATTSGTYSKASQLTTVVRDAAFKKIRVVLMEGVGGYIGHTPAGIGMPATIDGWIVGFTPAGANPADPYQWQRSRGARIIAASGAVAGATLDLNDKLKRSRGLE